MGAERDKKGRGEGEGAGEELERAKEKEKEKQGEEKRGRGSVTEIGLTGEQGLGRFGRRLSHSRPDVGPKAARFRKSDFSCFGGSMEGGSEPHDARSCRGRAVRSSHAQCSFRV